MKPPSLDELRAQARRTYRCWPIYLMLRLREVEQHLTPAQLDELGAVLESPSQPIQDADRLMALLVDYGLLEDNTVSEPVSPPPLELPPGDLRFLVESSPRQDWAALFALVQDRDSTQRLELLRTPREHVGVLEEVAALLMRIADEVSPQAALDAARRWAALHGARSLTWVSVPVERPPLSETNFDGIDSLSSAVVSVLPLRRRGKGRLRDARL